MLSRILIVVAALVLLLLGSACAQTGSDITVSVAAELDRVSPLVPGDFEWYRYCGTDPGPASPGLVWDCTRASDVDTSSSANTPFAAGPGCRCNTGVPYYPTAVVSDFELDRPGNFPVQLRWGIPLCYQNPPTTCDTSQKRRPSGFGFRAATNVVIPRTNIGTLTFFGRVCHFNYVIINHPAREWDFNMRLGLTIDGIRQDRLFNFRLSLFETRNFCNATTVGGALTDGCSTNPFWNANPNEVQWPACVLSDPNDRLSANVIQGTSIACCPFRTLLAPCADQVGVLTALSLTSEPFTINGLEWTVFLNGFSVPGVLPITPRAFFISEENRRTEAELYGRLIVRCPDLACPNGLLPVVNAAQTACECICPPAQSGPCPNPIQVRNSSCACNCPGDLDCGPCGVVSQQGTECECVPVPEGDACCPTPQLLVCPGNGAPCICTCPNTTCGAGTLLTDAPPCNICQCPPANQNGCVGNEQVNSTDACACYCPLTIEPSCLANNCEFFGCDCVNCTVPPPPCLLTCTANDECYQSSCPPNPSPSESNCVETYFPGAPCGGGDLCFQRCVDQLSTCQSVPVDCASQIDLVALYGAANATCYELECLPVNGSCVSNFVGGECTALDLVALYGAADAVCYTQGCFANPPGAVQPGGCVARLEAGIECSPDPSAVPAGADPQCFVGVCAPSGGVGGGPGCATIIDAGAPCDPAVSLEDQGLDPQCYTTACNATTAQCVPVARQLLTSCSDQNPCTFWPGVTDSSGGPTDACVNVPTTADPERLECRGSESPCIQELVDSGALDPEQVNASCARNISCVADQSGLHYCDSPCVPLVASKKGGSNTAGVVIGAVIGSLAACACLFAILLIVGLVLAKVAADAGLIPGIGGAVALDMAADNPLYATAEGGTNLLYSRGSTA